ncbi:C40 family peptidase [Roseateles sp.]|jgi:cell wall-associated NlpC family hydrolase|uniref:C40 family peptidase n=1 Tax=Roseateles sp. TaxID=1971397 RepID=UPI0037CA458A
MKTVQHPLRAWLLALVLSLVGAGVMAAPGDTAAAAPQGAASAPAAGGADAVSKFLRDRGLWSPGGAPGEVANQDLLNQVRDHASEMVLSAMNFLGVPYRRGGNSVETGFDCSGFTRHIFEMSLGLVLPRRADEQAKLSSLVTIKRDELKPGDLVFFNTMRRTFSHVGIYVGEGKFIHAPRSGQKVRVEDMREAYWAKRFTGARRAALPDSAGAIGQ